MPCQGPTETEMRTMEKHLNEKKYGVFASTLDITTRVACHLAKGESNELTALWIKEHQELDRKRAIEKEKALKEKRIQEQIKEYEKRLRSKSK